MDAATTGRCIAAESTTGAGSAPARSSGNRPIPASLERPARSGRSRDWPDRVRDPAHPEADGLLDDIAGLALKMAERGAYPVLFGCAGRLP
jgi:hypothetical protein